MTGAFSLTPAVTNDRRRARKIIEIAVPDIDQWRQRSTALKIGCDGPRALARPIDQHDLADRAAHDECERRTDCAGPDNSNSHHQLLERGVLVAKVIPQAAARRRRKPPASFFLASSSSAA